MLRSSAGREGFLINGRTRADLKEDGKMSSFRERLTRLVMMGPSSSKHCFKREVGIGSRGHCLSVEEKMSWWTSEVFVGRK